MKLIRFARQRWTKLKFSRLVFATLRAVSGTNRVALSLEYLRDVVRKLFAILCFVFLGAALIPYVQAAILNLPCPHLSEVLSDFLIVLADREILVL